MSVVLVTFHKTANRSRQGESRGMHLVSGCQQVVRELSAYLDQELSPEWRVMIEEHLQGCRNCLAVYDGLRNLLLMVTDNQEIIPLPYGFRERLYELLKKQSISRR